MYKHNETEKKLINKIDELSIDFVDFKKPFISKDF